MSDGWRKDKDWSDRFIPEIKRIIGERLIGEPPEEEDAKRNCDLIVLKMEAVRIACRVRRYYYKDGTPTHFIERWPDQFTIRTSRPSGNKTELTKIIEGWGDYFFYGFADDREESLAIWTLGDLKVFRLWFNQRLRQLPPNRTPGIPQKNKDNSSDFLAFKIDWLPPEFVVDQQKDPVPF